MKINEVFEKLIENPKDVYEHISGNKRYEFSVSYYNYFRLKAFEGDKELDSTLAKGGFTGNLKIDSDWQPVRKPTDFMTAANSQKNIMPVGGDYAEKHGFQPLCYWGLTLDRINGKWLIE